MDMAKGIQIAPQNYVTLNRPARDFVSRDMYIRADGLVRGHFHYAVGFTDFSKDDPALQQGYYLPLLITAPGKKMTVIKNDGEKTKEFTDDKELVLKVVPGQTWQINLDGKPLIRLDLREAVFEKKGAAKMNASFFDPGTCGLMVTGHIGTVYKDSKAHETAVEFENALPVGSRLIYIGAIPSTDAAGGTSFSVGTSGDDTSYVSSENLSGTTPVVATVPFPLIATPKVSIKLGAELTAGSIDFYATVIRLEV